MLLCFFSARNILLVAEGFYALLVQHSADKHNVARRFERRFIKNVQISCVQQYYIIASTTSMLCYWICFIGQAADAKCLLLFGTI